MALIVPGCGSTDRSNTPEGYVKHCIRLMDQRGLYSNSDAWKHKRDSVLKESNHIQSYDDAHTIIKEILSTAGGKHSFLKPPLRDTSVFVENEPITEYWENGILYICLPAHSGVAVSDSSYVNIVLTALKLHSVDAKGVIVDLRGNHGGNMYPMIAAVSPLVRDGIILQFQSSGKHVRVMPISLDFVLKSQHITGGNIFKMPDTIPVAILTDEMTGSSGEATLLAFRGMDNVRTFGKPTAGYASVNDSYILSDEYTLVLTVGKNIARTGEVFCDDPINPDIYTDNPIEDASCWIQTEG